MYLKRVVISGFKSFGAKTVVNFEPGVSGIVGPNGAGKSNVVEAIRWALGEQSAKQLRSGGREELVFAGTEGRPRASMAEVALVFDNSDGAFPLEVDEVEIARRIYRSGESEYRVMQRTARLGDVQVLLAEAGLGADSFAVVAQGTIDAVLLASPAERTLMFEEASGIRGLELKRQAALRKLQTAAANTQRLRDVANELAPRIAELKRVAALAEEHGKLTGQLAAAREDYLAAVRFETEEQTAELDNRQSQLKTTVAELKLAVRQAERDAAAVEQRAEAAQAERENHQERLAELDAKRAEAATVLTELLVAEAEREAKLTDLEGRVREGQKIQRQLEGVKRKLAVKQRALESAKEQVEKTSHRLEKCGAQIAEVSREMADLPVEQLGQQAQLQVARALQMIKMAALHLDHPEPSPQQLRLLIHKAGRFLAAAAKTSGSHDDGNLIKLQEKLERLMQQREELSEHHTNLVIAQRSLELDLQHLQSGQTVFAGASDELPMMEKQLADLKAEIDAGRQDIKRAEVKLNKVKAEQAAAYRQSDPVDLKEAFEMVERAAKQRQYLQKALAELDDLSPLREANLKRLEAGRKQAKEWGLEWPPAKAGQPAILERQCVKLAERIDALSELSGGRGQFQEAQARSENLATQIGDLERAEKDLRELVERLGNGINDRFKAGFASINSAFERYFCQLFGGGKAALMLEDLPGGYGIEISVALPGKRTSNLSSLSGGERALTGVALLAALLSQSRSPFIVLDEVDAALDEANSLRFADVLGDLGKKSQLIVVTHNRQTMSAAKNLYGVTLDRHNLSRVVSLRLDQARQLAARG